MATGSNRLTDTAVRQARKGDRQYKLSDGQGLQLIVTTAGGKLWRLAYRLDGRERTYSIGKYPDVTLAQARVARDAARAAVAQGMDPVQTRRESKRQRAAAQANSFESVARQWWEQWKGAHSPRYVEDVLSRLQADVFPAIGARPVADVQAPELVQMVKGIERRGALDMAKRCLQMCGQVFRYAIAHGLAERNPAADIRASDVLASRTPQNFARIGANEFPGLLRDIEVYRGTPVTRLAMRLMALTFVRTSELIGARWDEFDLGAARWDVPAARMKMKTPHTVPLSTQAINVLRALHTLTGNSALLFPGERDHEQPMSNNTILAALARMGYKGRMTGHGFRGLASTVLHEAGFPHEHIELQLAHQERNRVSAAYNHALYLAPRATMMQWWGDYIERAEKGEGAKGDGSNVMVLSRKAA